MFPLDDAGLWSGLVCGALFGFVLERAGFGSPCKLTGQFRLTDWSVLKVMFTAIVVAAAGLWALRLAGVVAEGAVYVPTSFLAAAAIGGVLVGIGFAVGGYCPGTSLVASAIGKIDGFFYVGGALLGMLIYGEVFPLFQDFTTSGAMGNATLSDWLNLRPGVVAFLVILMALGLFYVAEMLEKRFGEKA